MPRSRTPLIAGIVFLSIAVGASLLLVFEHLGAMSLPGCGESSPCARAAASSWARIPVLHWPTAFLGFAYFAGALAAWIVARGRVSPLLRAVTRLGALVSIGFLLVLVVEGYVCSYCLTAHLANLAFVFLGESTSRGRRERAPLWQPLGALAAVFVVVSAVLGVVETRESAAVATRQESERAQSTAEIIERAMGDRSGPTGDAAGTSPAPGADAGATGVATGGEASPARPASAEARPAGRYSPPWKGDFTGRYRLGPARAAVRIVIFTDYQCQDCMRIEADIEGLLSRYKNVSLSIKQFPMCTACNRYAERTLHPNACWAARAAEAAGILKGTDGFFAMHRWLFSVGGSFDQGVFSAKLKELGYNVNEFVALVQNNRTLDLVRADVEEAMWLGLHYTPMVFVNGVEMKGIFAPRAIVRTVEEVLAHDPPAQPASVDQPPPALAKYVDDWREQPVRTLAADASSWTLGPARAAVDVVVWGDYHEPNTAKVDSILQERIATRGNLRYTFRHFPVNSECNPVSEFDRHPLACRASRAAEAAGRLGGNDAYWAMHAWLLDHREDYTDAGAVARARALGLAAGEFSALLDGDAVAEAIREDCLAAKAAGLRSVPSLFVNRRFVPRWHLEGADPLGRILDEAASPSAQAGETR